MKLHFKNVVLNNLYRIYKMPPAFIIISFRRIIRLLVSAGLLACVGLFLSFASAANAAGEEKWYEVEVIVFANNKASQEAEKWPEKPGVPEITNVLELFTPTELLLDNVEHLSMYYVEPSEPSEDNLVELVEKIKGSSEYSLLMHRSWRQTAPSRSVVFPVYLDDNISDELYQPIQKVEESIEEAGEVSPEQLLLEALLAEESKLNKPETDAPFFIHELDPIVPFEDIEGIPESSPLQLTPMGPPNHSVFGTVKLFKNRFLHAAVDFLYRSPPYEPKVEELPLEEVFPMAKDDGQSHLIDKNQLVKSEEILAFPGQEKLPVTGFRLQGSKRIRLGEVHYFDHPMFGVIVRATNYTPPEDDSAEGDSKQDAGEN